MHNPHSVRRDDEREQVASEVALVKAKIAARQGSEFMEMVAIQNAMSNFRRKKARERKRQGREIELDEHEPKHSAWSDPDRTIELLDEVRSIWAQLTPAERAAFQLVAVCDQTYRQAAERLGVTPHAIKKRLQAGRKRIKNTRA